MTLDADALRERLDAPVVHRESVPSTSDLARARGRDGAPHGTMVVADEQSASRGRTGDAWAAPPGGVWASIVLRPAFAASHVGRLTFAGGLAAATTAEAHGVDARLKWPNDVVVPDGSTGAGGSDTPDAPPKLCGVLTEAVVDDVPVAGKPVDEVLPGTDPADADLSFAVLGVGLNAALEPSVLDVDRPVATLQDEVGDVDPTDVAATLHERTMAWVQRVESDDGFAAALDAWRERSTTLGERVRVTRRAGASVVGTATGVTETGALVVEAGGSRVELTAGECETLRRD